MHHVESVLPKVALEDPERPKIATKAYRPFYRNVYQRRVDAGLPEASRVVPIGDACQAANAVQCRKLVEKKTFQRKRAGDDKANRFQWTSYP